MRLRRIRVFANENKKHSSKFLEYDSINDNHYRLNI